MMEHRRGGKQNGFGVGKDRLVGPVEKVTKEQLPLKLAAQGSEITTQGVLPRFTRNVLLFPGLTGSKPKRRVRPPRRPAGPARAIPLHGRVAKPVGPAPAAAEPRTSEEPPVQR